MFNKKNQKDQECRKDVFCGVNVVDDTEQANDLEKMHLPVITAPDSVNKGEYFDVKVEVGKIVDHPNEPEHFIEFIELYADDTYLCRMDFTPKTTAPTFTAKIALEHSHGKLRAYQRCNLHGTWESEIDIEIK